MLKCSHIICKVNNITELVRDYEALGFSLQWGSAPERAHNALLWFEEGPFIEFFQMPRPFTCLSLPLGLFFGGAARKRWNHWSRSDEGWCDVALEPSGPEGGTVQGPGPLEELRTIRSAIGRSGVSTSRIINGSRIRPDGLKVKYRVFATEPVGLPFVVSAYDPPQRPERICHPNGAAGVEWVKMGVADRHLRQFRALSREDKWLRVEPSPETRVLEVGLSGLEKKLEAGHLHGAVFAASGGR